jgi:hypothetical protein
MVGMVRRMVGQWNSREPIAGDSYANTCADAYSDTSPDSHPNSYACSDANAVSERYRGYWDDSRNHGREWKCLDYHGEWDSRRKREGSRFQRQCNGTSVCQ